MHCHCGINIKAPWWTFTDPCELEVRQGAREESTSPAWLAAPAMNARDTKKMYIWRLETGCGPTLYRKCHRHNTPGKSIITLESNPLRESVLPAPHGKGNKCDKNVKYKRTKALSLWHQHYRTTMDIHGPLQTRGKTRCPGGVSVSCLASCTRHECPRHNESVYTEA